eukprot:jgi/Bigna1/71616/fgenesh1_pg.16_\
MIYGSPGFDVKHEGVTGRGSEADHLRQAGTLQDGAAAGEMMMESAGVLSKGEDDSAKESGAVALLASYLMDENGWSPARTFEAIATLRPSVTISLGLWRILFQQVRFRKTHPAASALYLPRGKANQMQLREQSSEMIPLSLRRLLLRSIYEQDGDRRFKDEQRSYDSQPKSIKGNNGRSYGVIRFDGIVIMIALFRMVLLAAPKPLDISAVKELQGHSDQHPTAKGEHMARWKRLFLSTAATSHCANLLLAAFIVVDMSAESVSRNHSTLFIDFDGRVAIMDHGSNHGTFINDRRLYFIF